MWANCLASPLASLNQFFIEEVSHVIRKVTKSIDSTSDKISKNNNYTKIRGGKGCL